MPSEKSRPSPSSTDLIIACGENKFLYFFDALALALAIVSLISSELLILSLIFEVGLTPTPSLSSFLA